MAAALLSIAVLMTTHANAQQATAQILGTVTDQQGAVVPGVKIIVTNASTNVSTETTSDKNGFYQVLDLPIGAYRINASHQGFRVLQVTTAPLEINQSFRADLKLEVGAATETIVVEAQAAGVETVNPTIGQSVTSRPIVNLPLNGRNVLSLALLQPGVTEDNPDDTGSASASANGANFNVAGGRSDSVTYLLDGGLNNELLSNGVVYNPNPDSVSEFRILTSNYTAEYGRNGSGIVSVVTKSGTNAWHGSAFEFNRNTDFDANTYFNKNPIANPNGLLPRNNLKRNQYGGTFGGPIIKNKLFFFAAYQGQRQIQAEQLTGQTVFTPAEIMGNFSQAVANGQFTVDSSGSGLPDGPVCNVATGCPDWNVDSFLRTNTWFAPANYATNCVVANAATWSNCAVIDPTKIDPAAMAYIATGFVPTSPSGGLVPSAGGSTNNNELTIKVDYDINDRNKLTGTIGGFRNPQLQPFGRTSPGYSSTVPGFPATNQTNNYFANIAYTRTFSSTILNELRLTAQRHNTLEDKQVAVMPAISQFGIVSDIASGPPLMTFDNQILAFGPDQSGPAHEIGNTYAVTDTISWVKGRNNWKFGAGFSDYQQNTIYSFFAGSNFAFYDYANGGDGTGNALADFLVGAPNYVFQGPNAANNIRSKSFYGFVQDEWRIAPNFTLNLGLRYEYSEPKFDTQGRSFSIVPGVQSTRFPFAPLGLVFPGDKGAPRGSNFPSTKNFGPRFGFAWSPWGSNKTSIRGGIGIFYDVLKGEDNLQFNGAPPFYSEVSVGFTCLPSSLNFDCPAPTPQTPAYTTSGTPYYSQPWTSGGLSANPFPSTPPDPTTAFNPATGGQFLPYAGATSGLYFENPHLHTPYTYQYNLSLQQEVARNMILELNYVASSSKGLTALEDANPFDLNTINGPNPARILNEQQTNANLVSYCALNFGGPAACPFGGLLEFGNFSFASFNSLEASLTKQLSQTRLGNVYYTFAYTYGHSIDDASGFRNRDSQVPYYNPGIFRSSSNFDVTHRVTLSGGWDLPFDQAWTSGPKRLVKGWSLYPIFTWRTGFPLDILSGLPGGNSADPGPSGAGDPYIANAVFAPGFNHITILDPKRNGNLYFNPAAFQGIADAPNPTAPYGLPRDFFRGPGRTNLDMALAKTTPITERLNLEMRLEAFNVLNHTEFANPDTSLGGQFFGQITTTTLGTGIFALQTQRILQIGARLSF